MLQAAAHKQNTISTYYSVISDQMTLRLAGFFVQFQLLPQYAYQLKEGGRTVAHGDRPSVEKQIAKKGYTK